MPDNSHEIDSPCSCIDCQRIDILWGDPLMTPWERRFVDNLSRWGWEHNYTTNQRAKLEQVFTRMKTIRLQA